MTTRSRLRSSPSRRSGNCPKASPAEAVEGAEGRVLLVTAGVLESSGPESGPRQVGHPGEVAIPERLDRLAIAVLDVSDSSRH
jgi:hypothetical protein